MKFGFFYNSGLRCEGLLVAGGNRLAMRPVRKQQTSPNPIAGKGSERRFGAQR
jgi:hypothetical protein